MYGKFIGTKATSTSVRACISAVQPVSPPIYTRVPARLEDIAVAATLGVEDRAALGVGFRVVHWHRLDRKVVDLDAVAIAHRLGALHVEEHASCGGGNDDTCLGHANRRYRARSR